MTSAPRAMAAQSPSIFACLTQSARNASLAPPGLRERSHGVLASCGVAVRGQELLVIRRNHQTGEVSLDPLRWGLIPYWCKDPTGGRKPINSKYVFHLS